MSELTTKLHIKQNDVIYEVTVYDNEEEATPEGGSYLHMFNPNNNETGYIGLWPQANTIGGDHTPLSITKNGIIYWLECTVNGEVIIEDEDRLTEILDISKDDINNQVNITFFDHEQVLSINDISQFSFSNDTLNIIYLNYNLHIPSSILEKTDRIIIPSNEELYNSLLEDNYWNNYIDKIEFVQFVNLHRTFGVYYPENQMHVTFGGDFTAKGLYDLGENLIIENDKCRTVHTENININSVDETVGDVTYRKYIVPNSSNIIYEIIET